MNQELQFLEAVKHGNLAAVKALLKEGADVNAQDLLSGSTTLHLAALSGDLEMAQLLISHSANVNSTDNDTCSSPLGSALIAGHEEMVRRLASTGATISDDEASTGIIEEARALGFDRAAAIVESVSSR